MQEKRCCSKGLAKLVNIVAETLLRAHMFLSLATQETLSRMQILRPCCKEMFLNQFKNIFALRTQMLHLQHMLPSLATQETSQETMFQQQSFLV